VLAKHRRFVLVAIEALGSDLDQVLTLSDEGRQVFANQAMVLASIGSFLARRPAARAKSLIRLGSTMRTGTRCLRRAAAMVRS